MIININKQRVILASGYACTVKKGCANALNHVTNCDKDRHVCNRGHDLCVCVTKNYVFDRGCGGGVANVGGPWSVRARHRCHAAAAAVATRGRDP